MPAAPAKTTAMAGKESPVWGTSGSCGSSGGPPLPYFEKAFVTIRIVTPRGSHNARVWDTSNRAIQIILNNPKGIFFEDDNIEHMAFSVIGSWGAGREYGDPGLRFRQIAAA